MRNILLWIEYRMINGKTHTKKKILLKTGSTVIVDRIYDGDKEVESIANDEVADVLNFTETFYNMPARLN